MLTSNVPVLETTRLILRAHRPEDFAASTALWGDPNVTRLIMGKPLTEEEVWSPIALRRPLAMAWLWILGGRRESLRPTHRRNGIRRL